MGNNGPVTVTLICTVLCTVVTGRPDGLFVVSHFKAHPCEQPSPRALLTNVEGRSRQGGWGDSFLLASAMLLCSEITAAPDALKVASDSVAPYLMCRSETGKGPGWGRTGRVNTESDNRHYVKLVIQRYTLYIQ